MPDFTFEELINAKKPKTPEEIAAEFEADPAITDELRRLIEQSEGLPAVPPTSLSPEQLGSLAHVAARYAAPRFQCGLRAEASPFTTVIHELNRMANCKDEYIADLDNNARSATEEERKAMKRVGSGVRSELARAADGFARSIHRTMRYTLGNQNEADFYDYEPDLYIDKPLSGNSHGIRPDYLACWEWNSCSDPETFILAAEFKYGEHFDASASLAQCAKYVHEYIRINPGCARFNKLRPLLLAYNGKYDKSYLVAPYKTIPSSLLLTTLRKARQESARKFPYYDYRPEWLHNYENLH